MPNPFAVDQLDGAIDALLARGESTPAAKDPEFRGLLAVAAALETLPNPDFKLRLKADLLEAAQAVTDSAHGDSMRQARIFAKKGKAFATTQPDILATLFGTGYDAYPVHRGSFMTSALAHTAALALIVTVGIFAAHRNDQAPRVSSVVVTDISPYLLPAAPDRAGGGGGGGDHDDMQASQGNPPRFAREQITPPAIVVRNESPKLTAEPTVVAPPSLSFPQTQMGDPLSRVLGPASNGTGNGGGIGEGSYGGVGSGRGPGVGPGTAGGIGGGPYRVGLGVSAPRAIYDPEPEYSDEARRAKYQGVVVLRVVVGSDGRPENIRVAQTLGMGLDQKAIDAVRQWRFEPGRKDGQPVAVLVDIQVNFRLY